MKLLNTIDGATLMSQPLHLLNFVVGTPLSPGLHILAGSPKVGKSWLALWLAVTVVKGLFGAWLSGGTQRSASVWRIPRCVSRTACFKSQRTRWTISTLERRTVSTEDGWRNRSTFFSQNTRIPCWSSLIEDKRGSGKAKLYCIGRDIEYRELEPERNGDNVYELVFDSREQPGLLGVRIIFLISEFMKARAGFIGTPTELAALVDPGGTESYGKDSLPADAAKC